MALSIKVGSRVMYSAKFLKSTFSYVGPMAMARGKVVAIHGLGTWELATIQWDKDADSLPEKVNVANLVLESRIHLEAV